MSSFKKRKIDQENRDFQDRWELEYLFINSKNGPQCLVCSQVIAVVKEYNIKRHYITHHEEKYRKYTGDSRNVILNELKGKLNKQKNLFSAITTKQSAALKASILVSNELAKAKKPFIDGELIKKCAILMAEAFNDEKCAKDFASVPLSHQTVARRVSEIGVQITNDIERLVIKCRYFSIALDESTDISDTSQLLIFIRTVDDNFNCHEELLKMVSLHGTTKGVDIYEAVKRTVEKVGGFDKCTCIATDGAKCMVGGITGLAGLLKKDGIQAKMLHCIIHQEALCGISIRESQVMINVTKIINLIRGGNRALTHRNFKVFLEEIESELDDLLLYSNVRWLSAGKSLKRFFDLRKEVNDYLCEINCDASMKALMSNPSFLAMLAFMTDITQFLNELNQKLQGEDQDVSQMYSSISGFRNKLNMLRLNLEKNDLTHFKSCDIMKKELQENGSELDIKEGLIIIDKLIENFNSRFQQFDELRPSFRLLNNPLTTDINDVEPKYQMELCDLQADEFFSSRKETGMELFKILSSDKYPNLRDFGLKMKSMFGSTYLCERTFSDMKYVKSKYRNCLSDSQLEHILVIATTGINVDLDKLVSEHTKPQCSH